MEKGICHVSKKEYPMDKLVAGTSIIPQILKLIKKDSPDFAMDNFISRETLTL